MAPRTVATAVAFQSSTAVAGTGTAFPPPGRGECPERASAVPAANAIASKATAVAAIIRQDRNMAPPPIVGESLVRDSLNHRLAPVIAPLGRVRRRM